MFLFILTVKVVLDYTRNLCTIMFLGYSIKIDRGGLKGIFYFWKWAFVLMYVHLTYSKLQKVSSREKGRILKVQFFHFNTSFIIGYSNLSPKLMQFSMVNLLLKLQRPDPLGGHRFLE